MGSEFKERGGLLLGFCDPEEDKAWDVVGDGVDEVMGCDEIHGCVGVLEANVAGEGIAGLAVRKVEFGEAGHEDAPVTAGHVVFNRIFAYVTAFQLTFYGFNDCPDIKEF